MDLLKLDEPFEENEIEWRIQQAGEGGKGLYARCLAYVTNRAIMKRLDEVVGKDNWQNTYVAGPGGGVVCRLSIRVNGDWITKEDGAENTDIESVKGGLSDAMKRAAYQWGIGRYLYSLPEGWAQICDDGAERASCKIKVNGQEKFVSFRWNPPRLPDWALPDNTPANKPERTPEYMKFRAWVVDRYGEEQVKNVINALFDAKLFASDEELFSCTDTAKFRRACEIAKEAMQPQTV